MIRATLRLRNDNMLAARERRRFTQQDVALMSGVSQANVSQMERLDFNFPDTYERSAMVAAVLEVETADILPEGMERKIVQSTFHKVVPMDSAQLEDLENLPVGRFVLPSPVDVAAIHEAQEQLHGFIGQLPYNARRVVELRKKGMTLLQVGQVLGLSKERVRQIESNASRTIDMMGASFSKNAVAKEQAAHERSRREYEWERSH